ncbi:MAG: hypothetical protein ACI9U2_002483 [Bradymonadia bacterium]|jgi:hypothetical protein
MEQGHATGVSTLKPDFDRLVALPFKHLVGAHGGLLRDDGPALLWACIARTYGASHSAAHGPLQYQVHWKTCRTVRSMGLTNT